MYFKNIDIELTNNKINALIHNIDNDSVIAFTDGSYSNNLQKGAYGIILIDNESELQLIKSFNKDKLKNKELLKLHSVAFECEAVIRAIQEAIYKKKRNIYIFYDYEGITKWLNYEWRTQSSYAENFLDKMMAYKKQINIIFIKVKSHNGIFYNELADKLAKSALLKP